MPIRVPIRWPAIQAAAPAPSPQTMQPSAGIVREATHDPLAALVRPQRRSLISSRRRTAENARQYKFVTTITEKFVPGLIALIQSMKENAGIPFEFAIVTYDPDPQWDRQISERDRECIEAMDVPVTWHHPHELGGSFPFDRSLTDCDRMAANIDKPLVWNLPFDECCCYTDADVLCLSSLEEIRNFPSFSVVAQGSCLGQADPDFDRRYRHSGLYPFNAGFFVYKPDPEIYREMVDYSKSYREPIVFGDQVPLNDFMAAQHPDEINYVPMSWNMCTWVLGGAYAKQISLNDVKLLHFAGPKPWADPLVHEYQRKPWELWQHYYSRAMAHLDRCNYSTPETQVPRFVIPSFDYRADLGLYLNRMGFTGEGVEVGVYRCTFSRQILKHWQGKKLWLVDRDFAEQPKLRRAEFIEADSVAAAERFDDESLDFAYIDAGHTYDEVMADLLAWYPKVRRNGLFCGHDYMMSWTPNVIGNQPVRESTWGEDFREMPFGVKQAVDDFAAENCLKVYTTADDEIGSPSWFAIKL